jgi:hypothetical protein
VVDQPPRQLAARRQVVGPRERNPLDGGMPGFIATGYHRTSSAAPAIVEDVRIIVELRRRSSVTITR